MTWGFPGSSAGKEFTFNAGDPGLIPRSGRSPAEGKGYPLQYSGLENSKDCIIHGVAKSWTGLSDFHFTTISNWGGLAPKYASSSLNPTPDTEGNLTDMQQNNHRDFYNSCK